MPTSSASLPPTMTQLLNPAWLPAEEVEVASRPSKSSGPSPEPAVKQEPEEAPHFQPGGGFVDMTGAVQDACCMGALARYPSPSLPISPSLFPLPLPPLPLSPISPSLPVSLSLWKCLATSWHSHGVGPLLPIVYTQQCLWLDASSGLGEEVLAVKWEWTACCVLVGGLACLVRMHSWLRNVHASQGISGSNRSACWPEYWKGR